MKLSVIVNLYETFGNHNNKFQYIGLRRANTNFYFFSFNESKKKKKFFGFFSERMRMKIEKQPFFLKKTSILFTIN